MQGSRALFMQSALVFTLFFLSSPRAGAQAANARQRVTQATDEERLVTLGGNVHPLARPELDHGIASERLPVTRMLLVLRRGAEQEAALQQLLDEQQVKSSPNYHKWGHTRAIRRTVWPGRRGYPGCFQLAYDTRLSR